MGVCNPPFFWLASYVNSPFREIKVLLLLVVNLQHWPNVFGEKWNDSDSDSEHNILSNIAFPAKFCFVITMYSKRLDTPSPFLFGSRVRKKRRKNYIWIIRLAFLSQIGGIIEFIFVSKGNWAEWNQELRVNLI